MHTFIAEIKNDGEKFPARYRVGPLTEFLDDAASIPHGDRLESRLEWTGGIGYCTALDYARNGDLSAVPASDALLDKLDMIPAPTARHAIVDDVVGAFPNVPAFIAGQPLSMRRKTKSENQFQPLAIVVDLGAQASVDAEDLGNRGIALLALVRAISARRPVELWVGCSHGGAQGGQASTFCRLDTQPLDLARAAFVLSHPGFVRRLAFTVNVALNGAGSSCPQGRKLGFNSWAKICGAAFPHMSDVLAVPSLQSDSPMLKDPVAWVSKMVAFYTGDALDAAA